MRSFRYKRFYCRGNQIIFILRMVTLHTYKTYCHDFIINFQPYSASGEIKFSVKIPPIGSQAFYYSMEILCGKAN